MDNLKDKLLSTGYFEDNDWLDKYIQLIENNKNTKQKVYETEAHHILQKAYFKLINKPIDNSSNNIVNLFYLDHALAHYYLCYCTTGKLKSANFLAFQWIKDSLKNIDIFNISEDQQNNYTEWYKQYRQSISGKNHPMYGKHHSDESKKKISKSRKGKCTGLKNYMYQNHRFAGKNHPMYGKHLSEEVKKKISESEKGKVVSKETRKKLSQAGKGNNNSGKPVKCIETDIIYKSASEAERQTKINRQSIARCCKKEYNTAGNLHWEYVN